MSHRRRALVFALAALLTGGLAAALVAGRGTSVGKGSLAGVVVAARDLGAGTKLRGRDLAVRRFPADYLPSGVVIDPGNAIGRRTAAPVPSGAYILAAQFRSAAGDPGTRRPASLPRGAVEIELTGPGSIDALGPGDRVDVLVTRDNRSGLGGTTRVLAKRVRLLALGESVQGSDTATLATGRRLAIRLVQAEAYARAVRLVGAAARGGGRGRPRR